LERTKKEIGSHKLEQREYNITYSIRFILVEVV